MRGVEGRVNRVVVVTKGRRRCFEPVGIGIGRWGPGEEVFCFDSHVQSVTCDGFSFFSCK